jgi:F-type H+-transporting ATPase subunit b
MKHFRAGSVFALLLVAVLFFAIRAPAAEQGASAAHEHSVEIFKWINFAIVAGLLGWVFLKLTPPIFRKRAESIGSAITQATAAKTEADRQLQDAEGKLARLQQEVTQLRATAEREGIAETERLRSATQDEVQKIGAAGKAEIEAAERAARMELKAMAANLAVDGAESLLANQLTPQTQEALVSAFVKTLEGRPN